MEENIPLYIVAETSRFTRGEAILIVAGPMPYREASDLMIKLNSEVYGGELYECIEV